MLYFAMYMYMYYTFSSVIFLIETSMWKSHLNANTD